MKKYNKYILLLNLVLIVVLFNNSVWEKEKTLKTGTLVLIPLAPVDPRSLMQGDYMNLNYNLGQVPNYHLPKRGYCIITIGNRQIAQVARYQKKLVPLAKNEIPIKYFTGKYSTIRLGAESYFFREGTADRYTNAKYGGLVIDKEGNSILRGLYDDKRQLITPSETPGN